MHIKLRQLAHARALFRHGSFRRAAESEHISQPALSRSIQSLEESLGVQLFDRQTSDISPTAFGKALLTRAEAILTEAAELEREILLLQGLHVGRLDVAMGLFPAELSGDRALAELLAEHPQLQISTRIRYWGELEQMVLAREIDLGFGEVADLSRSTDLRLEPIGHHELLFFCRPGHPILRKHAISVEDIDALPVASAPVRSSLAPVFPRNLSVDGLSRYASPRVRMESLTTIRTIVSRTDAVGYATPIQLEPLLRSGEVAVIPFRAPWLRLDYGFVYLASRTLSPSAEVFMAKVRVIERELAERNRLMVEELFQGIRKGLALAV